MHYVIVFFISGEVTIRLMMDIFFDDLFVGTPSSLMTIRLNLVNNASSAFALVGFS